MVDAGHHARRLLLVTGLDVEENQARRLLNDIDQYSLANAHLGFDEEVLAHKWLSEVFEPVVGAIPNELLGKLEPAELFHEVLRHRLKLSEVQGSDIALVDAVRSYISDVLAERRDESALLSGSPVTDTISLAESIPTGLIVVSDDETGDWRDKV